MADAVNRDWRRRRANNTVNLSHTTHGVEGFDQLVALVTELTAHVNALKLRDVEREQQLNDLKSNLAKWAEWADGRLRA